MSMWFNKLQKSSSTVQAGTCCACINVRFRLLIERILKGICLLVQMRLWPDHTALSRISPTKRNYSNSFWWRSLTTEVKLMVGMTRRRVQRSTHQITSWRDSSLRWMRKETVIIKVLIGRLCCTAAVEEREMLLISVSHFITERICSKTILPGQSAVWRNKCTFLFLSATFHKCSISTSGLRNNWRAQCALFCLQKLSFNIVAAQTLLYWFYSHENVVNRNISTNLFCQSFKKQFLAFETVTQKYDLTPHEGVHSLPGSI